MGIGDGIRVGLAGVGRGGKLAPFIGAHGGEIAAVCDVNEDRLAAFAADLGVAATYTGYERMLDEAKLDAVFIATPMDLHVPQSIAALERGLHVLCEVPAGVSLEQCRQLTQAAAASKAVYAMAENRVFDRANVLVRELVHAGLFGEVYYAEGQYVLNLRRMLADTPWRRRWMFGVDGISYGTHPLGPILQWFAGDRIEQVCCAGSGHHHVDADGRPFENQDTCVMLGRTAAGRLVQIRMDIQSDRPAAYGNYQLQGTEGIYEAAPEWRKDRRRIWLRSLSRSPEWFDLRPLMRSGALAGHLPEEYRRVAEEVFHSGHGGEDYFIFHDFFRAIRGEAPPMVGVHEAMDMTLPCLVSQQSISQDGAWLAVPDSRQWRDGRA